MPACIFGLSLANIYQNVLMIHQRLNQKQQVKILPQQIQLLNLFHLTSLELENRIQQELEENPLLEIMKEESADENSDEPVQEFADWDEFEYDDIPDYKTEYSNYFPTQEFPDKPIVQVTDFRQQLKEQCQMLITEKDRLDLAIYLIDSLNEYGMLEQDLAAMAEDITFKIKKWVDESQLEEMLEIIQTLDPPGIGARNIKECLLLQLNRNKTGEPLYLLAQSILADHYEDLGNRQLEKITHTLNTDEESLRRALKIIASLQIHPVINKPEESAGKNYIIPEFIVSVEEREVDVTLHRQVSSQLNINHSWIKSVKDQCTQNDKAANQYLKSKLNSAEWFVSALQQRENNMLKIMRAIIKWQYDYFLEGDKLLLKPMILKNIAEETGVDISTVSRITCNKYASTPFGNILLKDLFSEGMVTEKGENVSSRVIQHALQEAVEKEDKRSPYTDHQLVDILSSKGFKIARRTVAKYRELLNIPAAQMRALLG